MSKRVLGLSTDSYKRSARDGDLHSGGRQLGLDGLGMCQIGRVNRCDGNLMILMIVLSCLNCVQLLPSSSASMPSQVVPARLYRSDLTKAHSI